SAGGGVVSMAVSSSAVSRLQPAIARPANRIAAIAAFMALRFMWKSPRGERKGSVGIRRQAQDLAGLDQVGVVELVAVGLEDLAPAACLAVMALCDRRQGVAGLHGVGAAAIGGAGVGVAADVREVGLAGRAVARLGIAAALDVAEIRLAAAAAAWLQRKLAWILGGVRHCVLLGPGRTVAGSHGRREARIAIRIQDERQPYWRRSRAAAGGTLPGVARHGLMSRPPRRV